MKYTVKVSACALLRIPLIQFWKQLQPKLESKQPKSACETCGEMVLRGHMVSQNFSYQSIWPRENNQSKVMAADESICFPQKVLLTITLSLISIYMNSKRNIWSKLAISLTKLWINKEWVFFCGFIFLPPSWSVCLSLLSFLALALIKTRSDSFVSCYHLSVNLRRNCYSTQKGGFPLCYCLLWVGSSLPKRPESGFSFALTQLALGILFVFLFCLLFF